MNGNLTTAVLSPGGMFVSGNKRKQKVDIRSFGCSNSYHAASRNSSGGQIGSAFKVFVSKGICAVTPHHTTARVQATMELINIDIAGPYPESFGARGM